jgi:hypothetical protein
MKSKDLAVRPEALEGRMANFFTASGELRGILQNSGFC